MTAKGRRLTSFLEAVDQVERVVAVRKEQAMPQRTRVYSPTERAALAAMFDTITVLLESYGNKPNEQMRALTALACEVAAGIVRGERGARLATLTEIAQFESDWNTKERAAFNPSPNQRPGRAQ